MRQKRLTSTLVFYKAHPGCCGGCRLVTGEQEAGRTVWVRNHAGPSEGGSQEMGRRGRFSEKPQQTVSSMAQFNELNLCFLNGRCFGGRSFLFALYT